MGLSGARSACCLPQHSLPSSHHMVLGPERTCLYSIRTTNISLSMVLLHLGWGTSTQGNSKSSDARTIVTASDPSLLPPGTTDLKHTHMPYCKWGWKHGSQ